MATNEYLNSGNYHGRYIELHWWRTGTWNGNTCGSNIHWELHGRGDASASWYYAGNFKVIINGQQVYYSTNRIKLYNGTLVASGDTSIQHDNNGSKYFSAHIEAGIYTIAVNCSADGGWWLDQIPRNLDSINLSERSHGYNYIQVGWTCSPARDYTQYSLNGGAWRDAGDSVASDGKSGWFNVMGLTENTRYTIKVRLKRADSQLWSESNTLTITTSSGHTSITQFVVNKVTGRSDQLKITWAAGNACDYGWYSTDNGSTWKEGLSYPDQIISNLNSATSYKIKIRVRRKDSQMITESGTVTQTTYTQTRFTKNNVNHISGYSGLSQLKVEWSTNITLKKLELSLNNGSSWTDKGNPNSTSGSFTITSLSMNTFYNIKLRATSKDGEVVAITGAIKQNTYNKVIGNLYKNGTKLASTSGIQITTGDKLEFKDISNPAGCTYKIYLETPDNTRRITQASTIITEEQIRSMFQFLPNSNSQGFNVGIATMNGSIEAQYLDFYGNLVITDSNPIFNNFTYEDTDEQCKILTGGNQGIIKGYSNVKINISTANKAIAKDYATIKKYSVVIGEKQKEIAYSSSSSVSGQIDDVSSNVFTVYAIDSRGNSTQKQISPSAYYPYTNIKITKANIARTNIVGEETLLTFEGQYWNNSFGNIMNSITKCYYQYKTTSSDKWITGKTDLKLNFDGSKFSFSGVIKGDEDAKGFSIMNNFNIRIFVQDRLSSFTYDSLILGSGKPQIAISDNGVAINGIFKEELGDGLQINGKLFINGKEVTI